VLEDWQRIVILHHACKQPEMYDVKFALQIGRRVLHGINFSKADIGRGPFGIRELIS
jgi:hypothetical protein